MYEVGNAGRPLSWSPVPSVQPFAEVVPDDNNQWCGLGKQGACSRERTLTYVLVPVRYVCSYGNDAGVGVGVRGRFSGTTRVRWTSFLLYAM